jgi:CRP-like cAMP-binding protein
MKQENAGLSPLKQAIYNLHPLAENEWLEFEGKLVLKRFNKGEFLTRQGQVENFLYFINSGATRNYFLRDDKDLTVDFHFEGEFVTAYYSLITRLDSDVFIEALEDTEVYAMPYRSLNEFYLRYHNAERIGRLMAEYQYVKRLRKEMGLLSQTAEERYAELMKRNPALIQNISVKHLSSYLGIQPESLSRIRKQTTRN